MKKVKFEYDKNTSLMVIINEGWWFSLDNIAAILDVDNIAEFRRNANESFCRTIDNRIFCNFQDCCRRFIRRAKLARPSDWFFQTVVPQLRSMETLEQYKPITNHLGLIELENQEILTRINQLEATINQKFAQLTNKFQQCQKSLQKADAPTSSPIDLAKLREQQQYNNQIVENFIRTLEDSVPSPFSLIDNDDDPFMNLVVNSNGHGNSNRGK